MPMAQREHPSPEQLADFGLGRLDDEASAAIEAHLGSCERCRSVVERVPNDTLLSLLRHSSTAPDVRADMPGTACAATAALDSASAGVAAELKLPPELADHTRYQVLELLGQGGMGAVYKAEHRLMERMVALKLIRPALMQKSVMVERFRREVKAAARFSHPNIVRAYDADQVGEAHFLVMEFVAGISLAQQVEQHGPLPVDEACDYIAQAALGLQYAAEHGMVHRDIKPHNLMLTGDGQVKILDFGLARLVRERAEEDPDLAAEPVSHTAGGLTEAGMLMGTADFIAPEQAADPRRADTRADIYSLGCTLYFLLAGKVPFPGGNSLQKMAAHRNGTPAPLAALRQDVPAGLAGALERMMAKDPAQRYQNAADVVEALRPFTAAAAAQRRRRRRLAVAALGLAAVLLAATLIYVQTDNGELLIEADGDKVAVMIGDRSVKVRDEGAGREYQLSIGRHRLRPGEYALDVKELPAGVEFKTKEFILKRGGTTTLRVTFDPKKAPGYLKDDALRWFPADCTFFLVMNMEVVPEIARLPFLLMAEGGGEHTRRLFDLIGRLDRTAYAVAADRDNPKLTREFLRLTGRIARDRVIDHFRRQWIGSLRETRLNGDEIVILTDTRQGGGALAIIGTTDLVVANCDGGNRDDLPALQECLDLRAGRGVPLPVAQSELLRQFPDDAWEIVAGDIPDSFKKMYVFDFMKPIRTGVIWLRGTNDVEMGFRGSFTSADEARRFRMVIDIMRLVFTNAPLVMKDAELSRAVAQAFDSIEAETDGPQFKGRVRIPSRAFTALVEKIADTPLKELLEVPALRPAKRAVTTPPGAVWRGHDDNVTGVAFLPDGRRALSSSDDKTIRLWEVATGKQLRTFPAQELMQLSVAVAPDGRRALSTPAWRNEGSADESIRVWDVDSGTELTRLVGHTHGVWKVVISPDGKLALSASQDHTVRLWNLAAAREVRTFVGHTDGVRSVAFSPDGRQAVSGAWDCTVRLWDVVTGEELRRFNELADRVHAVAISPDGRSVLAAGGSIDNAVDTALHLWDAGSGKELRRFEGHTQRVWCVAFAPDGRRILSGSADHTLRLWDVATGQSLACYDGHSGPVRCVAFAPDGQTALSGSHDRTLQLWQLPP